MKDFLAELIEIPGGSGYEEQAAELIAKEFSRLCDQVHTDSFYNVYGIKGVPYPLSRERPKVMLAAHMDEIALMVKDIDEKGFCALPVLAGWIKESCWPRRLPFTAGKSFTALFQLFRLIFRMLVKPRR